MVHPANEYLQYFSREDARKEKEENGGSEQGAGRRLSLWFGSSVPATADATSR